MTGGVGARPGMYPPGGGGGRARGQYGEARQRGAASPVGWDKSYPLDPVEAVNSEVGGRLYCAVLYCTVLYCAVLQVGGGSRLYRQNVSRNNSYNKYSGNYGPRAQGAATPRWGHCAAH